MNKCRTCGAELAGHYHIDCEHSCVESLKSQLDLAKVNERDLNDIITALNDELSEKERQLAEAREAQNKLGEWVSHYAHCMRTVDYCGSLEDALEMEQYLYELKEKGE